MNNIEVLLRIFPVLEGSIPSCDEAHKDFPGQYIIHEDFLVDYIMDFCEEHKDDMDTIKLELVKLGDYMEFLVTSGKEDWIHLVEIGLLECLIDRGFVEIIPFLKPKTKQLLTAIDQKLNFDLELWKGVPSKFH